MGIFCPHCGNSVSPSDTFCRGCGRRLDGQLEQPTQLAQPAQPAQPQQANLAAKIGYRPSALAIGFFISFVLGILAALLAFQSDPEQPPSVFVNIFVLAFIFLGPVIACVIALVHEFVSRLDEQPTRPRRSDWSIGFSCSFIIGVIGGLYTFANYGQHPIMAVLSFFSCLIFYGLVISALVALYRRIFHR